MSTNDDGVARPDNGANDLAPRRPQAHAKLALRSRASWWRASRVQDPGLSDSDGPWWRYAQVFKSVYVAQQHSETLAEDWLIEAVVSRRLRLRCRSDQLPMDHARFDRARVDYPLSPHRWTQPYWVDPTDRRKWAVNGVLVLKRGGKRVLDPSGEPLQEPVNEPVEWGPADMRADWVRKYVQCNAVDLKKLLEEERQLSATPVQAVGPTAPQKRKPGPPSDLRDRVEAEVAGMEGTPTAKEMIAKATEVIARLGPEKEPKPKTIEGWVTRWRKRRAATAVQRSDD